MQPHDDDFHAAAYYVSRRKPADWVNDPAALLVARFTLLVERPRLVFTWGTWRAPPRRRARRPADHHHET
jgi:hypothetical protein